MSGIISEIQIVIKLFLLMGVGIILRKRGIITDAGKKFLSDLIIKCILPCSIVCAFTTELSNEQLKQTAQIFLIALIIQIVCYFLAYILCNKCDLSHKAVMQYAIVTPNSGTLGTPVCAEFWGNEGVLFSAVFNIPLRITMWTLGISFFTRKKGKLDIKQIVTHPCIAAVIIGILIMVFHIKLPSVLYNALSTIGGCNVAMPMLLIGAIAADMDIKLLWHKDTMYYTLIRLVLIPAATCIVLTLLGVDGIVKNMSVILMAMPAGSTSSAVAMMYNGDAEFASAITAVTTFLSILVLPIWCVILGI